MTDPFFSADGVTVYLGDCLEVMRSLPDASVDAVVTDPPYALTELATARVLEALAAWMRGDRDYVPDGGRGFMGRRWDRFVPPPGAWDECMRVLKPGGHLLAFASPRTVDLMGLSIRIAGLEIRDSIHWIGGQGFPKGTDVGKAIDKAAGAERKVIGPPRGIGGRNPAKHVALPGDEVYAGAWGNRWAAGESAPATADAARWQGWNTSLKPAHEPVIVARKPLSGTVVRTVLEHGTGALNIDACRIAAGQDYRNKCASVVGLDTNRNGDAYGEWTGARTDSAHQAGRWPTNVIFSHLPECGPDDSTPCQPGCAVAELDRQSGERPSGGSPGGIDVNTGLRGNTFTRQRPERPSDSGGASRFFPTFRYEAKATSRERPRLPDGTAWPTVKPLALMRWLVRLVTPPGGLVLDPFAGTGTTGEAALIEGHRAVLIERDPVAAELAKTRLSKPIAPVLGLEEEIA